jgi:ABC-type transport system substrate-binding protein
MDENRDSADRLPRNRHVIRWAAGAAAVAVLAGGGAALASGGGSASPAPTSRASALDAVLSSADAPTSAELAAASPAGATTSPATTSPATTSPAAAGPGAAGAARRCARAAAALKGSGHPRLARRAAVACRGRLGRLRLLIRGEHGQVTVRAKGGTTRTLAFERGKVTAVSGTAVTVAAADGTTWTWHLVADSVVRQGGQKVSASSLAAGQQVFAGGPVVSGADDARLIVIRPPVPAGAAAPSTAPAES